MQTRSDDLEALRKLLEDYAEQITDNQRDKFSDMRVHLLEDDRRVLTDRQRQFVYQVLDFYQPQYLNLVSMGKVKRGKEVPTPSVLQNLPKRPPGKPAQTPVNADKQYQPRWLDSEGNIHEGNSIPMRNNDQSSPGPDQSRPQ